MLVASTLLLLGSLLGAIIHFLLVVLLVRKRDRSLLDWLVLASLAVGGMWHAASAIAFFYRINTGLESTPLLDALDMMARAGQFLAPAIFFHVSLVWTGRKRWPAIPGYAAALAAWASPAGDGPTYIGLIASALLAGSAACFLAAVPRARDSITRRFFRLFGASLAVPAFALIAGASSAILVWASLLPPFCFAYFVYRYDFLGLLISRRVMFALRVGIFLAAYLFIVRRAADYIEDEYDFLGPLTELALIFAAALVWLPIYAWITRFLSKRTQIYDDFSKRLIQEAARILDIESRLRFMAEEVGHTFNLQRVFLITTRDPRQWGGFGMGENVPAENFTGRLIELARKRRAEFWHSHATKDAEIRRMMSEAGFNYALPLWYEDHLTGLLLLDASPRIFLDEEEPILRGLTRQISHSIENLRVVEEKIALEKTVLEQEHLAKLGRAAAAIAHEVKNPLSSIKTLVQLMREDAAVEGTYSRDLKYIVGEIDRLNGSVMQLLSFSRPAADLSADVDVSGLLDATLSTLGRQSRESGVEIERQIDRSVILKRSNPELLQQIVLNLVLNAVQASPEGGKVRIAAHASGNGSAVVSIEDEGTGIPAQNRERIFEPFFTTKQKGTGLGLAIVQKNVRQLRGKIEVESPLADGRGTRITLTLPLER